MGINDRFNNLANHCPGSVGAYEIEGCNRKTYTFCVHEIEILGTNIDMTKHTRWNPNRTLNAYGNALFCNFRIDRRNRHLVEKGLYCFIVNGDLKYVGKTDSSYDERVNRGYGQISPRSCYQNGNLTDCHINNCINKEITAGNEVLIGFYVMNDASPNEIRALESELIEVNRLKEKWNKQS